MPAYNAAAKELEYLHDWAVARGVCDTYHISDNDASRLVLMGGRVVIETRSGQHPERIAAEAVDGIVVVEAGQMPESIRTQCQGRVMTRRGWITYSGTIEDDEAKPRWAWFGQLAEEWAASPNEEHAAFALPSWANVSAFPDGRADAEIAHLWEVLGEHAFNRRIAGRPSGVEFGVYPAMEHRGYADKWGFPPATTWLSSLGAGGHDYGETYGHLTTLAVLTVSDRDEVWVREVRWNQSGDTRWIEQNRRDLSAKYGVSLYRWGFDPMQREAAEQAGAEVSTSRSRKVGLVEARLSTGRLFFDLEGPGVREAVEQMRRVHYVKREVPGMGFRYEYARVDDDMAAAVENAVAVIDGGDMMGLSGWKLVTPRPREPAVPQRRKGL